MNEPESNLQNAPRSMDAEEAHESLRRQINLLFGALLISSFTLTAFLALQAGRVSTEYATAKMQAEGALRTFQEDNVALQATLTRLQEFARTHPDFQKQILVRYKIDGPMPAAPATPAKPAK
jgi:hypothetical protein